MKAPSKPTAAYVGYQHGMAYRFVVDETSDEGVTCVRTLGWSHKTKGSLKELNERHNWQNARYQEIPESERAAEATRPTRWYLQPDGVMVPLPEWVPGILDAPAVQNLVRDQLNASLEAMFVKEDYTIDPKNFGALNSIDPTGNGLPFEDEPDFGPVAADDEPDFGPIDTDAKLAEMIEADDEEEDGWNI